MGSTACWLPVASAAGGQVGLGGRAAAGEVGACQEVVREAARNPADLIEAGDRFGGKLGVEVAEVGGELPGGAGAENGNDPALGTQPGQCHDGRAEAKLAGNC